MLTLRQHRHEPRHEKRPVNHKRANYAISGPLRSAEAIWEAPTWAEWDTVHVAVENYVGAGVFPAEDDGRYQWGEEAVLLSQSIDEA